MNELPVEFLGRMADLTSQHIEGIAVMGDTPFSCPIISQIDGNLWTGGCPAPEVPSYFKFVLNLYPWMPYRVPEGTEVKAVALYDDSGLPSVDKLEGLADWVNEKRRLGPTLVHCFPSGTLVGGTTPAPIEAIETVTGMDGLLHEVTDHLSRDYDDDLVVLTATGCLPVRSTPEHPLLVVRPYRFPGGIMAKPNLPSWQNVSTVQAHYRNEPQWRPASEVLIGDYLVAPRPQFDLQPLTPEWTTIGSQNEVLVPPLCPCRDHAWLVGLFAADGGTLGENSVGWTLSRSDDVDRLVSVLTLSGLTPHLVMETHFTRVIVSSRVVSRSFREWFGKSTTKRLPDFVFHGWPLSDVLTGYAAGDGYAHRRNATVAYCISPVLAEQIRSIALSLGRSVTMWQTKRVSGYANAHPGVTVGWSSPSQTTTAWWKDTFLMPVRKIEKEPYSGLVHNLEVADVESYTIGGATAHNCQAGLNRSGLVAALALIRDGMTPAQAIELLRSKRSPAVLCNPTFERYLRSL
jgi:protein-tyrosine phosphatase